MTALIFGQLPAPDLTFHQPVHPSGKSRKRHHALPAPDPQRDEPFRYPASLKSAFYDPFRIRAMVDKRVGRRRRVLKAGKIVFGNGTSVIDCTIRDLSDTGARLAVATTIGIPPEFDFYELPNGTRRKARIVWRAATSIGIAFI